MSDDLFKYACLLARTRADEEQHYQWWKVQNEYNLNYDVHCAATGHIIPAYTHSYSCYNDGMVQKGCYKKHWCSEHFDQHQKEVHHQWLTTTRLQ